MHRFIVGVAIVLASCSDSTTGASSGGGSSGTTSGSGSSVTLDASPIFDGTLTLTGTITLPPGSGGGKSIQLTASGGGRDITKSGSYVSLAGTTPGESVPYSVTGLVEGEYSIRARIYQNGDGNLASSGDLDGFSGGTVDAPVLDFAKATKVKVGPSGASGADFGVGKIP